MYYDYIRGPIAWACFAVFIVGMLFQVIRFFTLSRKLGTPDNHLNPNILPPRTKPQFSMATLKSWWHLKGKVSIIGSHPVMLTVTTVFHLTIFILPLFLLAHHTLFDQLWGASFCPLVLSQFWTDLLCIVTFGCLGFFIARRLFLPRVRAITTLYDWAILIMVAAPFVTGFCAIHNLLDYETMIIIHLISVNLLMLTLPFTKFVHMIFFFLNRFFLRSEYNFGAGSRRW